MGWLSILRSYFEDEIIEGEIVAGELSAPEPFIPGLEAFPPGDQNKFYNRAANDERLFGPGGIQDDPGYIAALAEGWTESD